MDRKFSAILFDMDGVLVDSMGAYALSWMSACGQLGIEISEEEVYRREGEKKEKSARDFIKSVGMMATRARVRRLIELQAREFASAPEPRLFPGVREAVSAFAEAGFLIGVVTGGVRSEFERLMPPELSDRINVSVCGDEVMRGKPNPEPYLTAIMKLDVKPAETAVIENAPFGIQSALKTGAYVVAIRSYLSDEDLAGAHAFVDDIRDLPKLFGLGG